MLPEKTCCIRHSWKPGKSDVMNQCRAEIGRLQSAAQHASFISPNGSILDESDDLSYHEDGNSDFEVLRGDWVLNESEYLNESSAQVSQCPR